MKHFIFTFHWLYKLALLFAINCNVYSAEIINASKTIFCQNESIIIQSSFIDTLNYSTNWEYNLNGLGWEDISLLNAYKIAHAKKLELNHVQDLYNFSIRVRYKNNINNRDTISNIISILIHPQLKAGIISGDQNICYNTPANPIAFSVSPSGGGNSYTYKWLQSDNNVIFTEISGANNNSYQTTNLTKSKHYKAVVISNLGCSSDTTNSTFVNVLQPVIGGEITIGGLKADTICYNSTPKSLTISKPATGGNGNFTFQWQYSTDGNVWQNQSGATQTTYNPGNLTSSRYYRMEFSTNCGIVYSDTIQVYVWPSLTKAEVGSNQTICWNNVPTTINTIKQPTGGNSKFSYHWQILSGGNWIDIEGANNPSFQPASLQNTTSFRLKNNSLFGCGEVYSDPTTITVYPKLQAGIISGDQNICYNTPANPIAFSVSPSGGGNSYTYKWLQSDNNVIFTEISGANNNSYQTTNLTKSKHYKAVVISNLGCSSDTTNSTFVNVLQPVIGGEITIGGLKADTICYNSTPKSLTISKPATGGNGNFTFQWQYSTDGNVWQNQSGATQTTYNPGNLTSSRYYRMEFSTNCGVVYSDTIQVYVNPLPTAKALIGNFLVCSYQQDNIYTILNHQENIFYEWSITGGTFSKNYNETSNSISVDWGFKSDKSYLLLKQTNTITGCERDSIYQVNITSNVSPNKTIIIRKSTSNILICEESNLGITYNWGFVNKGNGEKNYIPESNRRYIMLPHIFDTANYEYFVETIYSYSEQSCSTTSFLNTNELTQKSDKVNIELDVYPIPTKDFINIEISLKNKDIQNVELTIFDIKGKTLWIKNYNSEYLHLPFTIPLPFGKGIYFLEMRTGENVTTRKLVVK